MIYITDSDVYTVLRWCQIDCLAVHTQPQSVEKYGYGSGPAPTQGLGRGPYEKVVQVAVKQHRLREDRTTRKLAGHVHTKGQWTI